MAGIISFKIRNAMAGIASQPAEWDFKGDVTRKIEVV